MTAAQSDVHGARRSPGPVVQGVRPTDGEPAGHRASLRRLVAVTDPSRSGMRLPLGPNPSTSAFQQLVQHPEPDPRRPRAARPSARRRALRPPLRASRGVAPGAASQCARSRIPPGTPGAVGPISARFVPARVRLGGREPGSDGRRGWSWSAAAGRARGGTQQPSARRWSSARRWREGAQRGLLNR